MTVIRARLSLLLVSCVVCLVVMGAANTQAARKPFWDKPGYFTGRIGFIGGGNMRLEGMELSSQPGFTFGAALDFRLYRTTMWGISVDVHRMHLADSGQYLFDVAATLKHMIFASESQLGLRPGLAFGYAHMDRFYGAADSDFLVLKGTFELIFFTRTQAAFLTDLGVIASVKGHTGARRIRLGPFPYLRIGMMF